MTDRSSLRGIVGVLIVLTATASLWASDPNQAYQEKYGEEAKKVGTKDIAAFALRLISDSATLKDDPGLAELLIVKAQEFSSRIPPGDDRSKVSEALIEQWLVIADDKIGDNKPPEALAVLDKASKLASFVKSSQLTDIQMKAKAVKDRIDVDKKLADLLDKIKAKPDDAAAAKSLVLLYLLSFDNPAKAQPYLQKCGDEALKTYVTLAAKEPGSLEESALVDLGGWYENQAAKGNVLDKAVALGRANTYYGLFLDIHAKQDADASKAKKAIAAIEKESTILVPAAWAMPRGPREITLDCSDKIKMKLVLIQAGKFLMGSPDSERVRPPGDTGPKFGQDEVPQHEVIISKPFYMGVYDVTQEQYLAVTGVNRNHHDSYNDSVETVSWIDANGFCAKFSAKTGKTVQLPTEAQWEYACRAGTTTPFYTGETISTDQANYNGEWVYGKGVKGVNLQMPTPVGHFKPNAFGLYDMHGNVWQWCRDWYGSTHYIKTRSIDPQGPSSGTTRVHRGGCFRYSPVNCRSAARGDSEPTFAGDNGFRVVVPASGME